ncbi:CHAT domain-containing protein [Nocardiopsis sp. LOL_012]|uniref:CHAT domain-containing protein n=1 Tax=Nocardiopsis sp. LOL_012 TaxID=3345409 RepID=UPI003A8B5BA1
MDTLRSVGAEVETVQAAGPTDVWRVLDVRPDVLHLACHGEGDRLLFEDLHGEAQYVPAADLAGTLGHYRDALGVGLRGVVLSSCDGEHLAPHFTAAAGAVVAHRGRLDAPCAVAFRSVPCRV